MGRASGRKKWRGPRGPVGDPPAPPTTRDRVRDTAVANAYAAVERTWDASRSESATEDGSDTDPERGPETERVIAGERVRTVLDKVMGGIAVSVVRTPKGAGELGDMVWFLGLEAGCGHAEDATRAPESFGSSHRFQERLIQRTSGSRLVTIAAVCWRNRG
jgi:hypothetical protein